MTSPLLFRGRLLPRLVPYAFVAVPLAYMTLFVFGPLIQQVWMSFTDTRLMNPTAGDYIGLENYQDLFSDSQFYTSLNITIVYTILTVVIGVLVGTISAVALDRPFKGRAILRTVMLFGWAVPSVAATLVWLWIFNGQSGVASDITEALGLGRVPWLTSVDWALTSIMFVTIWQVAPFVMLVMMAALQSVPEEVREAARIDGADALNVFRNVTLPCIMPTMQVVALLVAVWSIRRFEVIYLLTGGGPIGSTSTLVVQLRLTAFEDFELGLASAYGVVGLILALLVASIHFLVERRRALVMLK
ncbi:multiple sugar transport system permease protein [Sagittula marina]|uniref:Multiple sugar transport system permease protein n=1 Tax=Sagittula marina TaxID=943940 RepID=A0A7W6DP94_9RHOB|nr:sugar ABC transporter permease [Sagittula marina]MBB3984195.1 multiple sugar transport system permease protein [Sagittula marina]